MKDADRRTVGPPPYEGLQQQVISALRHFLVYSCVIIERIVASVPNECVVDKTARVLLVYSCQLPYKFNHDSGRPLNRFPSDNVIRHRLSPLLGKHIAFDQQYIETTFGHFSLAVCVFVCVYTSSCMACLLHEGVLVNCCWSSWQSLNMRLTYLRVICAAVFCTLCSYDDRARMLLQAQNLIQCA